MSQNVAFSTWVKSGVFTMTLTQNHIQALNWIIGKPGRMEHFLYENLAPGTATSLMTKGLIKTYEVKSEVHHYPDGRPFSYPDQLAVKLTYAGMLVAALLYEAGMIPQSLDEISAVSKWIDDQQSLRVNPEAA